MRSSSAHSNFRNRSKQQASANFQKIVRRVRDLLVLSGPISDISFSPLEGEARARIQLIVNRTRLRIVRRLPGNNDLRFAHFHRNVGSLDLAAAR